ncbi:hypothetical protein Leryth_020714, partial [Lithospermum erythrorhizon]
MDELYAAIRSSGDDFTDKALMSPADNLMMIPPMYNNYHNNLIIPSSHQNHPGVYPLGGSDNDNVTGKGFQSSGTSQAASITGQIQKGRTDNNDDEVDEDDDDEGYSLMKAKIASHPSYPKLLDAYIDCRKVGAPAEIASLLDEIRHENNFSKRSISTSCYGADPELDEFMETYCKLLVKYKEEMSRPFDEASNFISKIEAQLGNLCKGTN